ncbi:FMN-binding negative transcriptional regulator [Sphingobacterium sp. SYP-B4668]|uniref:FMN-binding negative transcriptional regulator n=1 Tax=Sphingobacterium sp. SYP-B4668 TaxID=2996035 RepID=UPI0022DDCB62|nr:FMN-binding negative transcriptional regulator [Sphingobacterium sp. SYP-B4668]
MYIPKHFAINDRQEMISFMKQFSFAPIITFAEGNLAATHLPFVIEEREGAVCLTSHFAIANAQAKSIEKSTSLIIFSEPHAYISPSLYGKVENVPTWDYIAVHAYGRGRILESGQETRHALEKMIGWYEEAYSGQWQQLPDTYKARMMKGIVAFEIKVADLQGQAKLSQNKNEADRKNIKDHLEKSEDTHERMLAAYMKR